MTYPLSPIICKLCKHLDKKISIDKDKKAIGRCGRTGKTVYLDNDKRDRCGEFRFFLEK